MQTDVQRTSNAESALAEEFLTLLRKRIKSQQDAEALAYFDKLFPPLVFPVRECGPAADLRVSYNLQEFLAYHDEEFLEIAYLRVLKREIDPLGLQDGLRALREQGVPRTLLLGRLRYSGPGKETGVEIRGLRSRYFMARLQRVPVIGRFVAALANLDYLSRLELDTEVGHQQSGQFHRDARRLAGVSSRLFADPAGGAEHSGAEPGTVDGEQGESAGLGGRSLAELLAMPRDTLIEAAYTTVLGRKPAVAEIADIEKKLSSGRSSRILFLGDLFRDNKRSAELRQTPGLEQAYRMERRYAIPLLGPCLKISRALRLLPRLESILDYHSGDVLSCTRRLTELEVYLQQHYNNSLEAMRAEIIQAQRSVGANSRSTDAP